MVQAALVAAFVAMPTYAARRRDILAHRRREPWWLVRTLLFDRRSLSKQHRTAESTADLPAATDAKVLS